MIDNEAFTDSAPALYLNLTILRVFKQIKDDPKDILLSN